MKKEIEIMLNEYQEIILINRLSIEKLESEILYIESFIKDLKLLKNKLSKKKDNDNI